MTRREDDQPDHSTTPACRCVVLADPDAGLPGPLLQALAKRGLSVSVATDAPSAMLELIETTAGTLIIVDPQRLALGDELVTAVRHYFPRTALWAFQQDAQGRRNLASLNGHSAYSAEGDEHAEPDARPSLDRPDHAETEGPIVTKDELAMLLGGNPGARVAGQ